ASLRRRSVARSTWRDYASRATAAPRLASAPSSSSRRRAQPPGLLLKRWRRGGGRGVLAALGGGGLAFPVVPVVAVGPLPVSLLTVFELIPASPGLTQYRRFFASPDWMAALARSVQVALGTTVVATVLGTLAALGLVRIRSRWRTALE